MATSVSGSGVAATALSATSPLGRPFVHWSAELLAVPANGRGGTPLRCWDDSRGASGRCAPIALRPYGDGPFWARRLDRVGVSVATIPQRQLTVDRLADAFRVAVSESQLREHSCRLATQIGGEDGAQHVVADVNSLRRQSA